MKPVSARKSSPKSLCRPVTSRCRVLRLHWSRAAAEANELAFQAGDRSGRFGVRLAPYNRWPVGASGAVQRLAGDGVVVGGSPLEARSDPAVVAAAVVPFAIGAENADQAPA